MNLVKIRFKNVGKIYYFSCDNIDLKKGDKVVVETIRGLELGFVVSDVLDSTKENIQFELKPVLRVANDKDLQNYEKNKSKFDSTLSICKELVVKSKLSMKIVNLEFTLDGSKLIIYFEAEERVDFRQLVKDLAQKFKARIELRQIGPRDSAKLIGGIGPCGLVLCCNTHIGEFDNISIKMAKNQNLSLNPQKISGVCGKLLCCIKFENDTYLELKSKAPKVNTFVKFDDDKKGKIINVDVISNKLQVRDKEGSIYYLNFKDVVSIDK